MLLAVVLRYQQVVVTKGLQRQKGLTLSKMAYVLVLDSVLHWRRDQMVSCGIQFSLPSSSWLVNVLAGRALGTVQDIDILVKNVIDITSKNYVVAKQACPSLPSF